MPSSLQARLWAESGVEPAYVILDGALDDLLVPALQAAGAPAWRCLWAGELEPDMASVAPYLVELVPGSEFTRRVLSEAWGRNLGIFLASPVGLARTWRHLRQHARVQGPQLEPLYFRFYDPRVLRAWLPACTPRQLVAFFGPVRYFFAEAEDPGAGFAWTAAGGQLVTQQLVD